jgi:hypothetical protein
MLHVQITVPNARNSTRDFIFFGSSYPFEKSPDPPKLVYLPILWHVTQPLHARGLVGRVGPAGADVHLARHGLVDDGLLLLLQ